MESQERWEQVYRTRKSDQVSWYRQHLEMSLDIIQTAVPVKLARIIDVGGGESTLVDDLLDRGYRRVTVLDLSATALAVTRERLGDHAQSVTWLAGDATRLELPEAHYDIWHDRAVFHFLTDPADRARYVQQVIRSVKPGGTVIVATFGPDGPRQCSGLDVVRYDADRLHAEFGARFELISHREEIHDTPFGTRQQFLYCYCKVVAT